MREIPTAAKHASETKKLRIIAKKYKMECGDLYRTKPTTVPENQHYTAVQFPVFHVSKKRNRSRGAGKESKSQCKEAKKQPPTIWLNDVADHQ